MLQVTDFGLSQSTNADTDYSVMGSPYYVAPEVLTRQLYSPSCDVWATGILVYKMLCGRVPFPNEEKIKQVRAGMLPAHICPHSLPVWHAIVLTLMTQCECAGVAVESASILR